jgi:FAD/FMN-containing dehydrogenase
VNFARERAMKLSVRGGGHNVAGFALCDGLVVDLSRMRSVRVDVEARTARAEPGLTWADFDRETQAFGLATTGGVVGSTGVAGLTLGGGVGWLHALYGLTADNLLSADVVLADGRLVTASPERNEDLFWARRGGGGNFGIVTSFEFRLHPIRTVLAGPVFHPAERAAKVLRFYRDFTATLPDELTVYAGFLTSPEGQKLVGLVPVYVGPVEEGERLLRPLREFGEPVADLVGEIPYLALQSMFDAAFPAGIFNYWKSGFLADLSDEALDTIARIAPTAPSPTTMVMLENYHGAYGRVGRDETAYPHRDANYDLLLLSSWTDPAATDANVEWTRAFYAAIEPHLTDQAFPNLMGQEETANRVGLGYGENFDRLAEIKARYDPTNFFRANANITPKGAPDA